MSDQFQNTDPIIEEKKIMDSMATDTENLISMRH